MNTPASSPKQTPKMGWSLISRAQHLLRHDPKSEQVTEKMALHGPIIKAKVHEQNIGLTDPEFWICLEIMATQILSYC